jgi:hypothetical protein
MHPGVQLWPTKSARIDGCLFGLAVIKGKLILPDRPEPYLSNVSGNLITGDTATGEYAISSQGLSYRRY